MNIDISERTQALEPSLAKLAIETRELRKVYGEGNTEVVAMKDASVSVRQGEVGRVTWSQRLGKINVFDGNWSHQSAHQRSDMDRW